MKKKMFEIDSCPFCGHRAETKVIDRKTFPYGCLIVCYCTNCLAQTRPIEYDDKNPQESEQKVAKIWNQRIERMKI